MHPLERENFSQRQRSYRCQGLSSQRQSGRLGKTLEFENDIDQTCLESFRPALLSKHGRYLRR